MTQYRTLKAHPFGKVTLPAGALIEPSESHARWLAEQGVISKPGTIAKAQPQRAALTMPRPAKVGRCCGG